MELTKEEAIRLHRELWGWLADNPHQTKSDWVGWQKNGGKYNATGNCFACEYAERENPGGDCLNCPFLWGTDESHACYYSESPYVKYVNSFASSLRAKYAAMIRDLPVRE